ncbi:fla cluster protein FlaF [Halobacterium zhouii]|uniref:fla cluster protein FlaF n=1 Tax=Halobacterium zhouii TaxID=2902624 RepID=UPI001E5CE4DB|nr:fla cluster protein FlaF [Halobacterium zhouii]
MGFSVSGSAAIIFLAAFMSVGVLYSAAYNGYEQVQTADDRHAERVLERRNTAIDVTNASYNGSGDEQLVVNVTNEGATSLSVNGTSLLVDGSFVARSAYASWNVEGSTDTSLWLPGETYTIVMNQSSRPDRVKVVTPSGNTATEGV